MIDQLGVRGRTSCPGGALALLGEHHCERGRDYCGFQQSCHATTLAVVALGERDAARRLAGAALIVIGVVLLGLSR
jgi:hypothetical protein